MQQLTFAFPHYKKYREEDFIVSQSNKIAFNLIKGWPTIWGVMPFRKFIIICGIESSGKTYLSHIWQRKSGAFFLTPEILEASISRTNKINEIVVQHSSFILEDIDNENWKEAHLLHFFNLANEYQKYVLLTAKNLAFKLHDLNSRIASVFKINIESPTLETVKSILTREFDERNLKIHGEVLDYIVVRIPWEYSALQETVNQIDKISLEGKRNVTIPFLKSTLGL